MSIQEFSALNEKVKAMLPIFRQQSTETLQVLYDLVGKEGQKYIKNSQIRWNFLLDSQHSVDIDSPPTWVLFAAIIFSVLAITCIVLLLFYKTRQLPTQALSSSIKRPASLVIPGKSKSNTKTEAVNTDADVDEFMLRMFSYAMVVRRHKPHEMKWRCIKLNEVCELCVYKSYRRVGYVNPSGGAYIKLPLKDLLSCFRCEGSQPMTFMLEFRNKSIQFSAEYGLDDGYLFQGFRAISRRIKIDSVYLQQWEKRFQFLLAPKKNSFRLFSTPSKYDDDDMNSVTTINTILTK